MGKRPSLCCNKEVFPLSFLISRRQWVLEGKGSGKARGKDME